MGGFLILSLIQGATTKAQDRSAYIREIGAIGAAEAGRFGLQVPQDMTFDPASGRLFILDGALARIVRIDPASEPGLDRAAVLRDGRTSVVDLEEIGLVKASGIAFNLSNNHLYLVNPDEPALYELSETGQVVTIRDLSASSLVDPQGMVFAPSRDQTDDPAQLSLYIADGGRAGQIIEFSLDAPPPLVLRAGSVKAILVRTINTSQFSPPSPDPAGIAYLPSTNTLFISDSEVSEMPVLFTGDNLFETTLSGNLVNTSSSTNFSNEPTGAAFNANNGHLFLSDDDEKRIFEVDPGADGDYGTADDIVTSFRTPPFNSGDPEGVAFNSGQGAMFIADGVNNEVYRVMPGANGVFDGVPPAGDDVVTHFDSAGLGVVDPEGIEFNPDNGHLYLVGKPGNVVAEVTMTGQLVQTIDIAAANALVPAGLAYGPSSLDPGGRSLYVADRGVDNDDDPNENDGKVYEFLLVPEEVAVFLPLIIRP